MGAFLHHYWPLLVAAAVVLLVVARPKPEGPSATGRAVGATGRAVAPCWLEWAAGLGVLAAWAYWARRTDSMAAGAVIVGLPLCAWFLAPQTRNATRACFGARKLRRNLTEAIVNSKAFPEGHPLPRLGAIRRVPLGDVVQVEAGKSGGTYELEKWSGKLAEILHVREVCVTRDPDDPGRAEVLLVRTDPFQKASRLPWPNLAAARLSVWEAIPFGRDKNGRWEAIRLFGEICTSVLMAGATRRGKSRGMALLLATAALDPDCDIWLMDGKEVELSQWQPVAQHFAGKEGADAVALLERLQGVMQAQYAAITADGRKKVRPGEYRPQILFIDEIAHYLSLAERDQSNRIMDLIINIAAMGLGAGVACVIATQQPAASLHPRFTTLRANLEKRIAYGMMSQEGSRMTLGPDAASAGYSATSIPKTQRGVCWALTDGDVPILTQTCLLTDEEEKDIISRAIQLRMGDELDAMLTPVEARSGTQRPAPPKARKPAAPAPTPPPPNTPHAQQEGNRRGHPRAVADRARLLALLADGETWTLARLEAAGAMGAPRLQWRPELDALVEEGVVLRWLAKPVKDGRPAKAARGNPWLIRLAAANESGQGHTST